MIKEARYYARMAYYFQQYLRTPPIADAPEMLKRQVETRESNFLAAVEGAIFGNPRTPYATMLALAGCGAEDLREAVRRHGLEKALEQLLAAGVYLTNDEVKGAKPIVRHGREIPNPKHAFENPAGRGGLEGSSSGSRRAGPTGETSTAWRIYRECYESLLRREFGLERFSEVSLMPILPAPWGISLAAVAARLGGRMERWFAMGGRLQDSGHYRAATSLLVTEARLLGYPLPYPEYLPQAEFGPVAEYLGACSRGSKRAFVRGTVSAMTRVCTAARERNIDISGTVFLAGGEALTDARRGLARSLGAQAHSRYIAHEVGPVGMACRQMTEGNTVHLFTDALAVVVHRRRAPLSETEVDSLAFTTLNPAASRVYINVELDDAGRLQPARCDCEFSRAGMTTALTGIESFGKLTGFGMTLIGTQILPVLEDRLPARFGGGAADFQLVERRGEAQMELCLRVDPRLGADADTVRYYFLDEIQKVYGGALTRRTWEHTGALRVELGRPYATNTGKVLPLHLAISGGERTGE